MCFRLRVAILGGVLAYACTIDLEVPDGVEIGCASNDDCPVDFVCRPTIGLCIRKGSDDQPPSIVGPVDFDRDTIGIDSSVAISFTVSELALEAQRLAEARE